MSEEYTPTTDEVRRHWGIAVDLHRRDSRLAEFDRMIAEVERAAAEKAWDEGYTRGNAHNGRRDQCPYRKEHDDE